MRQFRVVDFTKPPFSGQDSAVLVALFGRYIHGKSQGVSSPMMSRIRLFLSRLGWVTGVEVANTRAELTFNLQQLLQAAMPDLDDRLAGERIDLAHLVGRFMRRCQKTDQRFFSHGVMGKKTLQQLGDYRQLLDGFTEQTIVKNKDGCYSCCDEPTLRRYAEHLASQQVEHKREHCKLRAFQAIDKYGCFCNQDMFVAAPSSVVARM